MTYPREERETTCVYSALTHTWDVYTCEPKHLRRLTRLYGPPDWTSPDGESARWYSVGPKQVSFRGVSARKGISKPIPQAALDARRRGREGKVPR